MRSHCASLPNGASVLRFLLRPSSPFSHPWPPCRATPDAPALMTAAQPNARAEIFLPSEKLARSCSASGPSRRSQDFSSTYSSGPVGTSPSPLACSHAAHPLTSTPLAHQPPSAAYLLTVFLAPFRADRVSSAKTILHLASAPADSLRAERA